MSYRYQPDVSGVTKEEMLELLQAFADSDEPTYDDDFGTTYCIFCNGEENFQREPSQASYEVKHDADCVWFCTRQFLEKHHLIRPNILSSETLHFE